MVEAPSLCERVLRIVAKEDVPAQVATGEAGIGKLAKAGLVACEEARSRCGGQYLRRHAREPRAVRYGMERGMPHLLCFLGQRIAQGGNRLNRRLATLRTAGRREGSGLLILKQSCETRCMSLDLLIGQGAVTLPPPPSRCRRALRKPSIPSGLGSLPRLNSSSQKAYR
jgi:hypothetical protein